MTMIGVDNSEGVQDNVGDDFNEDNVSMLEFWFVGWMFGGQP